VTSLEMLNMSAKASRLACRKSTSALSYLDGSLVPIRTVLVGSLGSTSIALVSVRRKALDEAGSLRSGASSTTVSRSLLSSLELAMMVASLKCYRLQAYICSKEPLTMMTPFSPDIFNLR
jgi:hypothetical protein